MSAKRILFVDDEQPVLDGLRNVLRKQRSQWDLVFADRASIGLQHLAERPFDVLVSDMRMPGMDGAAFLRRVKHEYPAVTRIVLSGHADRESVERALPVAHQFLTKPCDGKMLTTVIERVCALRELVDDPILAGALGGLDRLPSATSTYDALTRALTHPDARLGGVAKIIECDPAMSAKVLQIANSSYFRAAAEVSSVRAAVNYLGLDLLRRFMLQADVFATRASAGSSAAVVDSIQRRSFRRARLAKRLASDTPRAEEAFTAGLLQDVGSLAASPIEDVRSEAHEAASDAHAAGYLLGMWGLPGPIVEAVVHQGGAPGVQSRFGACDRGRLAELVAVVHVANAWSVAYCPERRGDAPVVAIDFELLETTGYLQSLAEWNHIAQTEMERSFR